MSAAAIIRRVAVSARMVTAELARTRVALLLVLVVPTVFYWLVYLTTGERPIGFRLSALGATTLTAIERDLSIVFIGMAAVSGISAFLAFVLVLRAAAIDRRLVFEGYRAGELLTSKMLVMTGVAVLVALYVTALLPLYFRPDRPVGVFLGFALTSLLYGSLGLAIGAVARRDLEGILVILLLVNIDAGWLQNPVFFAHAHNPALIRLLPGHHPGQVAMLSAFTDAGLVAEAVASLFYTAALLAVAAVLYWLRIRVARPARA